MTLVPVFATVLNLALNHIESGLNDLVLFAEVVKALLQLPVRITISRDPGRLVLGRGDHLFALRGINKLGLEVDSNLIKNLPDHLVRGCLLVVV